MVYILFEPLQVAVLPVTSRFLAKPTAVQVPPIAVIVCPSFPEPVQVAVAVTVYPLAVPAEHPPVLPPVQV